MGNSDQVRPLGRMVVLAVLVAVVTAACANEVPGRPATQSSRSSAVSTSSSTTSPAKSETDRPSSSASSTSSSTSTSSTSSTSTKTSSSTSTTTRGDPSSAPTAAELSDGTTWRGSFTITIEVWDYCASLNELSLTDTYTRTEPFSFSSDAPMEVESGLIRESNPFSITAGGEGYEPNGVNLSLFSALPLSVDEYRVDQPYLQQYWELAYSDGRLTGELVDDGIELGAAANHFWDENPLVPCQPDQLTTQMLYPMKEGASLVADIGHTEMSLTMEGRSVDEARRWQVEATATRS
jgi:hypothetical protein